MTPTSLFDEPPQAPTCIGIAADAWLLRGFVGAQDAALLAALEPILEQAPPRQMLTPGGRRMSVRNTNCGPWGWVSDRRGYRYVAHDPQTDRPWPAMPESFAGLADAASRAAGFGGFAADACLINVYEPGTRMSLHQDRDERDFAAPIVSVSLGLPATFLFGGSTRNAKPQRIPLLHGDVLVWGGASRLAFHGVAPVAEGHHPLLGRRRVNLTLRKAF
ncbi:MAG TPA: DNA oxidative demethylase AlkB [Rhodanobacteraceae bacterium]|nr:DNA oxidative demethylase AlkB [Rhodanobacteraceae bacterium]